MTRLRDIKKIIFAMIDFISSFIYNVFVFWGLTQSLDMYYFGELVFLLTVVVLFSPVIVLSLPNFIMLPSDVKYQDKITAATVYVQTIILVLFIPLIILLYSFSYDFLIILFVLQSILSISEIVPRTLWKNRSARDYAVKHLLLVLIKVGVLLFLYIISTKNFMSGALILNFITTLYFWKHIKVARQSSRDTLLIIKQAWLFAKPLLVSGFIVLLYTRTDQLMIKFMIDNKALAEYSVAVKVSDGIISVWTSVQAFFLQALLSNQHRYRRFISFAWLYGIVSFVVMYSVSDFLIPLIFGITFTESSYIVKILSFGMVFVALNSVGAIWLQSKNLGHLTPMRSMCGLIVNAIGNVLLIPAFGIAGAAFATVLSQFAVCFIAPFFSKKMRTLMKMQFFLKV